ncbi:MAG: hypothetical protein EAZ84_05605 [Verrucomicrobia bacterium]|nr:MAG: hypothetical protein EAZ84_05605 [Verrucomicrobiota bacterium]TAE86965.1 MAG: hypothetical protein EAZ82_09455 [Verrucomicrobiota bacterium]TAF24756.1 MAG: hypothetical protein EAZ71_09680 [Verrucomicrobiota bacterium]
MPIPQIRHVSHFFDQNAFLPPSSLLSPSMNFLFRTCVVLALNAALAAAESSLEADFRNPPVAARPYVWWHWMGSNFSKEGITKDLEAMKAAGIGGATIFNITSAVQESHKPTLDNPWPDQTYRSPKYWDAMRHAAAEAGRLGLELGLHNTVGYSTTGGPWIDQQRNMQQIASKSVRVEGGKRVSIEISRPDPVVYRGWGATGAKFERFEDIAVFAVPAAGDIDPAKAIDLSDSFKNGRLDWDAPAGSWELVRLCSVPTGASPHPVPDELVGKTLEADKMSLEQSRYHWDQVIEPMKQHLGPYLGKSFKHFLIDSYEAGPQTWTASFRDEFQQRKGYDPLPWLLSLQGRVVGNAALTARFKWDHADVVRALYYEHGWQTAVNKMKAVGMDLQFEPYGGPFDTVEGAALADLPMGEFWTSGGGGINGTVVAASRAAGRRVVGAEAFTGPPAISKWNETPGFLKRSADGTLASGANRLVLHHWVHQPFDDRYKPGMGMGWWGTHFNRHQTWAKDGSAFFAYLGRVQALLQSGETPSDFVSIGKSQGSDIASWREFREGLQVKDGRILLSSGRSYPFLGIPHDGLLSPSDLRRITSLLERGAVIVCAKPRGAPGLAGYPQSDAEVKASTLWDGGGVRAFGKGKLYTRGDIAAAVRDFKIEPIARISGASGIVTTARRSGGTTLFFVANTREQAVSFTGSFRIDGQRPELWDAEDGSICPAPVWRHKDGRCEVDLSLGGHRSIFVVFRDAALPADHVVSVVTKPVGEDAVEIVKARFGAAEPQRWLNVTDKLRQLAAGGGLDVASVSPGVFGKDPVPNVIKTLEVEYGLAGKTATVRVVEGKPLRLGKSRATDFRLFAAADGSVRASATGALCAELVFASGKRQPLEIAAPASPVELKGPWEVALDSPVAQPRQIKLSALGDLASHADDEVRYFSGTATYRRSFKLDTPPASLLLDLGRVHDLARIVVNGRDLGVLWQAPYRIDIGPALKAGSNRLEIAVTNTWHNRLVGDEQRPADFEWGEDRGDRGRAMKAYPAWFLKNQPRPESGRKCFVVWYYHRKDSKLLPAGLLGPVRLLPVATDTTRE